MESSRSRVVVVGDLVTDVMAVHRGHIERGTDTVAQISARGGGSAANTAAWLAHCGLDVDLVSVVGDDQTGAQRIAELAAHGVGIGHIRADPASRTGTVIVLSDGDDRSMLNDRGANDTLRPVDVDGALTGLGQPAARHLHLSGYALLDAGSREAGRHAVVAAKRAGLTVSVDAASAGPLRRVGAGSFLDWIIGADLLLANVDEALVLAGNQSTIDNHEGGIESDPGDALSVAQACGVALTAMVPLVVIKAGAAGSVWCEVGAAPTVAPALRPNQLGPIDPTGAGDAFAAGLLAAWLSGDTAAKSLAAECLAAGAQLGALAVTTVGGRPMPTAGP